MKNFLVVLLLFFAIFGLPEVGNDSGPSPSPKAPTIIVPEPSAEMKSSVSKIAEILKGADYVDRSLWAQIWTKAAKAVDSDSTDTKVVWNTTNKLRQFTETALRIGWRRLGGNKPGKYEGLNEAIEAAFTATLTNRVQDVTPELRKKYVDLCYAIAWAGIGRDK